MKREGEEGVVCGHFSIFCCFTVCMYGCMYVSLLICICV